MTLIDNTLSEPMENSQAAPPSIFERLKNLTLRKRRTAKETHCRFCEKVGTAGYRPNDREISEWHEASERAGFSDEDTANHVALYQRLAATEAHARNIPAAKRACDAIQAQMADLDQQMAALQEKRTQLASESQQASWNYRSAMNAAASVESLRNQIAELSE